MVIEINADTLYRILTILISLSSVITTIIIAIYVFKKEPSKTYIKERYEKVIFPIYIAFEPFLYSRNITEPIKKAYEQCQAIINNNKMIAGGNLLFLFDIPLDKYTVYRISREIDKEYDKSCKKLGIQKRSLNYRMYLIKNVPIKYLLKYTLRGYLPVLIFLIIIFLAVFLIRFIPNLQIIIK